MPPELEEGQAPKKKKGMLKWIILVVILLLLGVGGYFAYTMFFAGDDTPPEGEQATEQAAGEAAGEPVTPGNAQIVTLPSFLVNLADPLGRRYLKMTVDVEVVDSSAASTLQDQMPKIRDAVILLLSSKTYGDLSTLESKILLKKELVERLNLVLGGPKVLHVYFTEMVIQ